MFILIDRTTTNRSLSLEEPSDFKSFKVVITAGSTTSAEQALSDLGRLEAPDHVFIDQAALEGLAGPELRDDAKWRAGLDAMIDYASKHGWTDDEGRIRAHVERL